MGSIESPCCTLKAVLQMSLLKGEVLSGVRKDPQSLLHIGKETKVQEQCLLRRHVLAQHSALSLSLGDRADKVYTRSTRRLSRLRCLPPRPMDLSLIPGTQRNDS